MNETLQPHAPQLPPHEYGGHLGVYGRPEVYEYEQGMVQVWQGVTEAEKQNENFAQNMAFVRQDMQAFAGHPELNQIVNDYFDGVQEMPQIFLQGKAQAEATAQAPLSWSGWLAEAATDDQLLNFLQWHNYRHENRPNDPEFQAEIAQRKAEFMRNVRTLQAQGGLHEDTLTVEHNLDTVQIIESDIFNAYIFGRVGFSHEEGNQVEVIEGGAPSILAHELKHKVIERPDDSKHDLWAREAIAEHTAQVMTNGANLNQFVPSEGNPMYGLDRTLMSKVMHGLDPRLVMRYYSALNESSMAQTKAELEQAFVAKYGVGDVIDRIGEYIDEHSASDENTTRPYGVYMEVDLDKRDAVLAELIDNPKLALGETVTSDQQNTNKAELDYAELVERTQRMRDEGWSEPNISRSLHQRAANGHATAIRQEPHIDRALAQTRPDA